MWQLSVQLDFDHVGASPAVEVDTVMSHEVLNTKFWTQRFDNKTQALQYLWQVGRGLNFLSRASALSHKACRWWRCSWDKWKRKISPFFKITVEHYELRAMSLKLKYCLEQAEQNRQYVFLLFCLYIWLSELLAIRQEVLLKLGHPQQQGWII